MNHNNFFSNDFSQLKPECNLSCNLYDDTCNNLYTGTDIVYSSITEKTTATASEVLGYEKNLCMKCSTYSGVYQDPI